jgi:hypothetical protein
VVAALTVGPVGGQAVDDLDSGRPGDGDQADDVRDRLALRFGCQSGQTGLLSDDAVLDLLSDDGGMFGRDQLA